MHADRARASAAGCAGRAAPALVSAARRAWTVRGQRRRPCGTGMTIGVPVTGSGCTTTGSPNTSSTSSGGDHLGGVPVATTRAVAHRDQVVGVARRLVQVVQHGDDRAALLVVEPLRAGPAPRTGGRGRGTSSARRAAASACPGPAPWRSTPAGAARRTARRPAVGQVGHRRGRRAPSAPARRRGRSTGGTSAGAGGGHGRRGRRRSTRRARRAAAAGCRAWWRPRGSGVRWIGSPSSSTAPPRSASSRARPRSSVDLPHAFAPTMTVNSPVGDVDAEVVDDHPSVVGRVTSRACQPDGPALLTRSSWPGRSMAVPSRRVGADGTARGRVAVDGGVQFGDEVLEHVGDAQRAGERHRPGELVGDEHLTAFLDRVQTVAQRAGDDRALLADVGDPHQRVDVEQVDLLGAERGVERVAGGLVDLRRDDEAELGHQPRADVVRRVRARAGRCRRTRPRWSCRRTAGAPWPRRRSSPRCRRRAGRPCAVAERLAIVSVSSCHGLAVVDDVGRTGRSSGRSC